MISSARLEVNAAMTNGPAALSMPSVFADSPEFSLTEAEAAAPLEALLAVPFKRRLRLRLVLLLPAVASEAASKAAAAASHASGGLKRSAPSARVVAHWPESISTLMAHESGRARRSLRGRATPSVTSLSSGAVT